jgi:hypothetical protein
MKNLLFVLTVFISSIVTACPGNYVKTGNQQQTRQPYNAPALPNSNFYGSY